MLRNLGSRSLLLAACTFGALSAAGCTVTSSSNGSIAVDWTIAGSKDPNQCATYGAATAYVHLDDVTDARPYSVADYSAPCTQLSALLQNLDTFPVYRVSVWMVDSAGQPITTTVVVDRVNVSSGLSTAVPVDFPDSSFSRPGGSITITWDLANSKDYYTCNAHRADSIHFRLVDATGALVGSEQTAPCTYFGATTSFAVPVGSFTLSAEMYQGGTVRTTSVMVPVTVNSGAITSVPVTFPDSSFLP